MKLSKFSIAKRLRSFVYAFNGLHLLFKDEANAWIHLLAAICVVVSGFVFNIKIYEWIAVVFAIGLVFSLEIINSSIEKIADFVCPERNSQIKKIKDLSAAAVLVGALVAFIIGSLIFIPKILSLC
jgi:diacylglycerol kinase